MMRQQYDREHLKNLLLERSVRLGDFTLSSGAKSPYYIDARRTTMTAEGQRLTGKIVYNLIESAGKEPKGPGTGPQIGGGLPTDARVVVVEDAVTSGASAIQAIKVIRKHGASVAGVICLVDREEGGRAKLDELGLPLLAVFTGPELLAAAQESAAKSS